MLKSVRILAMVLSVIGSAGACFGFDVSLAVKRGQKTMDHDELPLVCLGLGMKNAGFPLQRLTLENAITHQRASVSLSKLFHGDHPDYLTARASDNQYWSLLILRMPPGDYRVLELECNVPELRNGGTLTMPFSGSGVEFRFKVQPGVVNYVGSLVLSADWKSVPAHRGPRDNRDLDAHFRSETTVEQTEQRDFHWARDVVPCMRDLPSVVSALEFRHLIVP